MTYFSARLPVLYPTDAEALFTALEDYNVPYALLEGTKDVWVRDFMPVRTRSGRMLSFRYEPSYLAGAPELRTDFRRDMALQLTPDLIYSAINLDGGNVVLSPSGGRALVSDRIYAENPDCEPSQDHSFAAIVVYARAICQHPFRKKLVYFAGICRIKIGRSCHCHKALPCRS